MEATPDAVVTGDDWPRRRRRESRATRPARPSPTLFGAIVANVERGDPGQARGHRAGRCCACWPRATCSSRTCPAWARPAWPRRWPASIDCTFGRVQFTPDLLPSDVVGVSVWNRGTGGFEFRPGPIFANIVLADEINRASPKTQSALLEAMAERQVTVDGTTYRLGAAVHGDRHPEPDRARGHLSPAREPARPLPHAGLGRLPGPQRRDRDPRHPRRPRRPRRPRPGGRRQRRGGDDPGGPHRPHRPQPQGATSSTWPRPPAATPARPRHVAPRRRSASSGRPGPGPRPPGGPTSSPTTSRRWPSPCSPTASSSRPRPSWPGSTRPWPSERCSQAIPIPGSRR